MQLKPDAATIIYCSFRYSSLSTPHFNWFARLWDSFDVWRRWCCYVITFVATYDWFRPIWRRNSEVCSFTTGFCVTLVHPLPGKFDRPTSEKIVDSQRWPLTAVKFDSNWQRACLILLISTSVLAVASFQQNLGGRPDRRPFLSTSEPSPTPGDTGTELSAVQTGGLLYFISNTHFTLL